MTCRRSRTIRRFWIRWKACRGRATATGIKAEKMSPRGLSSERTDGLAGDDGERAGGAARFCVVWTPELEKGRERTLETIVTGRTNAERWRAAAVQLCAALPASWL